jgi:hypothetical protein
MRLRHREIHASLVGEVLCELDLAREAREAARWHCHGLEETLHAMKRRSRRRVAELRRRLRRFTQLETRGLLQAESSDGRLRGEECLRERQARPEYDLEGGQRARRSASVSASVPSRGDWR